MKRLLAIILASCMIFTFAACGNSKDKATVAEDEEEIMTPEEAAGEPTQQETLESIDRGTVEGTNYKNEWAGVTFAIPEGMTPLTADEMAKVLGQGNEQLAAGDEAAKQAMDTFVQNSYVPLFMINDVKDTSKLKIQYIAEIRTSAKTEEEYLTDTMAQIKETGLGYAFSDKIEEVKLGKYVYTTVTGTIESKNAQISYYVRKIDEGFLVLSVGYTKDRTEVAKQWIEAIV
ncbi:MAG: hypothetical protein RR205_02025 [Oscillospiraceae bacterium]